MTRDEANRKWNEAMLKSGSSIVDGLIALGVLKVDQPKTIARRFADAYINAGCSNYTTPDDFLRGLVARGLKVVEA